MPKQKTKNQEIEPRVIISDVNCWCRHDKAADIVELIENPRNPNLHPADQIELLAKIIKTQGWRQPITVSNRSGFIVKGHGRLQASKLLKLSSVPVEYQDYKTEADEYADLIADNRISELSSNDEELISDLLADDMFEDFDMDLTGFDAEALDIFEVDEVEPPLLDDGDKTIRQMTFTVHDSQCEEIEKAISVAKREGAGESSVNENSNGNALSWICERFNYGKG